MTKSKKGGIILCRIHTRFDASFVLDPAVVPADAVYHARPLPARRWTVADGPCGKTQFNIFYSGDRAQSAWIMTSAMRDAAADLGAYARRVLNLPDTTVFKEGWTAIGSHHRVSAPVYVEGLHGDARVDISIYEKMCNIRAPTFSDLEHVTAAIMRKEPFAPVGECIFGMDSDELRRISRCAAENVTFKWRRRTDRGSPFSDGWPPIHDGVLAI